MTSNRARLRAIAAAAMRARGLDPEFPRDALAQTGDELPPLPTRRRSRRFSYGAAKPNPIGSPICRRQ